MSCVILGCEKNHSNAVSSYLSMNFKSGNLDNSELTESMSMLLDKGNFYFNGEIFSF